MESSKASIVYNLTLEDMVASTYSEQVKMVTIKRQMKKMRLVWDVLAFFLTYAATSNLWIALALLLYAELFTWYWRVWGYRRAMKRVIHGMYTEGENPGLFGEYLLEVDSGGITVTTEYVQSRFSWGAITRIDTEADYTQILLGTARFLTIPHKGIVSGDFRRVLEQIKQHYDPSKRLLSS